MFREEIDYFHAPQVGLEIVFAVRSEKVRQGRRRRSALGNGPQKLGRWLGDTVIAQQRFAKCGWFPPGAWNLFSAGRAERMNDFIDQFRVVAWINRQRIAHFKAQLPSREIDLKMACILLRLRTAKTTINDKASGKRVCPC